MISPANAVTAPHQLSLETLGAQLIMQEWNADLERIVGVDDYDDDRHELRQSARELEQQQRADVLQHFNAITRTNYAALWQRGGSRLEGPLWAAARWQRRAEESDSLFRGALKTETIAGVPDGRLIEKATGLTALLDRCEADWERVHQAMLSGEVRRAA
jgi:hypothetical protein